VTGGRRFLLVVSLLAASTAIPSVTSAAAVGGWERKVSARVLRDTAGGGSASFLVLMASKADLTLAAALPDKADRGGFVFDTLRAHADRSQASVRALLDGSRVSYRTHWLVNVITVVRGDRSLVRTLASRPDVARIDMNESVRSVLLPTSVGPAGRSAPAGTTWNVRKVKAPEVWRHGFRGQGIVVGSIDTGFQWDHPALQPQYRGWDGSTADHNYSWYDEIDPANRVPSDGNGHGTATVGVMIGDDGGPNRIGVAPGAKWIGCRAMDRDGFGTPDTYIGCLEFMVAPFDLDGSNPDPTKAPDVISNSWFCSISAGECPDQAILLPAIQDVRAAGIVPVVAAGNSGPNCASIGIDGPPAQYDESFTVGAVTNENGLATFSSRGPVSFQGTRIKPDMVAPGQDVRSSWPPNTYSVLSGTSIAAPHIAGVIALVYSAKPSLIGDVDATERLLGSTAVHVDSSSCSSSGTFPNNLYGWGFVNAARAGLP
jgi:serine protease AprX